MPVNGSGGRDIPLRIMSTTKAGLDDLPDETRIGGRVRLMIIDPRALTRDCLVAALEATGWYEPIIAVNSVTAAIKEHKRTEVLDVVVLNLARDSFEEEGLKALADAIRTVHASSGFVILASQVNRAQAAKVLAMGVRGFLDSDTPLDIATEAIRFVARGWMIYPAFDFSEEVPALGGISEDGIWSLRFTARQRQVLDGLERGLTNGRIAVAMNVSERTIKAHVKEIMRRFGASNRTQVVARMARMRQPIVEEKCI